MTWRSVRYASPDHHWPTTKQVMLDDVTGSITFTTVSPDSFTTVTCAHCEPALICEEKGAPMADLESLVRNMHTSSLLEVILWGSGSAPPLPPRTKKQILVLLLGWCPSTALSSSPWITAVSWCLLHALEIVLGDTANHLVTVWMCPPGGAGLPVQPDWAAGTASCYQ